MPAFENVNANSRSEVYSDWLLWMALFEFNSLFAEAGQLLADGCQQITNAVLAIGVQGVEDEDLHTIRLVMKFFNTFMRTGVNAGNIKLCCRVLNDYRKLVEAIMQVSRPVVSAAILSQPHRPQRRPRWWPAQQRRVLAAVCTGAQPAQAGR